MNHYQSSKLYESAIETSLIESLDSTNMLQLYQDCRRQYDLSGKGDDAGRIFVMQKDYELSHSTGVTKIALTLYKLLSQYGESPLRVVSAGLVVILLCSIIYFVVENHPLRGWSELNGYAS